MATPQKQKVEVPPVQMCRTTLTAYGTKSLLMQRLARQVIELPKFETTLAKLTDEVVWAYFNVCLYIDRDGDIAFPAVAFKKSCVDAARYIKGAVMTEYRGLFFIEGDQDGLTKLYNNDGKPIKPVLEFYPSDKLIWKSVNGSPYPLVEMVHKKIGGAIPVVYAKLDLPWKANLNIIYSDNMTSGQEIARILEIAGTFVGIGARRPERSADQIVGTYTMNGVKPNES